MKTIFSAFKLFKRQMASNIIIIIFFSLFCSVSVYMYNQYEQETACYKIFSDSNYSILYANLPEDFMSNPTSSQYIKIRDSLADQANDIQGYVGTSTIVETFINMNSTKSDIKENCTMYMIDGITSNAFKYKPAQGKWLSDANSVDGAQPCIIGGSKSRNYNIGDILKITFIKTINQNDKDESSTTKSAVYYVAGKFEDKQQFFNITLTSSSNPQPISNYFCNINTDLYLWVKNDLSFDQIGKDMDYSISSNPIIYIDKSLSHEILSPKMKSINACSIFSGQDLMIQEQSKITEDYEFILPIIVMIAIVSIIGIYSMCMLNVFKNYKMFAIFYLCGCSKLRNVGIIAAYSSFFMIFTILLVGLVYCLFTYVISITDLYISQYIYMNFEHFALIILLCLSVSSLSFITPFALLRKMSIAKQLNVE